MLWALPFGTPWINASYDYLFRFGSGPVSNNVVVVHLDNEAYDHFQQSRDEPWDRRLHADLLNRLADDGCSLVVIDSFFRAPREPASDAALADAMRRQKGIVLMAHQARITLPDVTGARPVMPAEPFLSAARTNWGVAWLDPDLDGIVRRHWPFPSPGPYPSLPEIAAQAAGAKLHAKAQEKWLRYYPRGSWPELSYRFALSQPDGFYRDRVVFIGSHPETSLMDGEVDEFSDPKTRWSGESVGGVEILATEFLNLVHSDWLRRPPASVELLCLTLIGVGLSGISRLPWRRGLLIGGGLLLGSPIAGILLSHFSNHWFPWLIVAGGQIPLAMAWAGGHHLVELTAGARRPAVSAEPVRPPDPVPEIPDYELYPTPFGEGAYGKVWLARNKSGGWDALKVIYRAKFETADPYEREFLGVSRYCRVSDQHPGLLRVKQVSEKGPDFFYYIMELGDGMDPAWTSNPSLYKPRDLVNVRLGIPGNRLPTRECVRIGITLCEALQFLHEQGLTHRDIKPQNILFVNGRPKLADVGLIAEIRPDERERTLVGTPGYMPPHPEIPGTPQADLYSLGMVLYVVSTGGAAALFPEISSTLVETRSPEEFHALNAVIIRACQPELSRRFASATEMIAALKTADTRLEQLSTLSG